MIWMERLTERLHEGCYGVAYCVKKCDGSHRYCEHDPETCPAVNDCFDKLGRLEDLQEAGRLVVLPEGDGKTLFLKVLAYNDAICPSCLGLKGIPCNHETDCMACWEAALKGGDLNE